MNLHIVDIAETTRFSLFGVVKPSCPIYADVRLTGIEPFSGR
jgi:hypothetical protein